MRATAGSTWLAAASGSPGAAVDAAGCHGRDQRQDRGERGQQASLASDGHRESCASSSSVPEVHASQSSTATPPRIRLRRRRVGSAFADVPRCGRFAVGLLGPGVLVGGLRPRGRHPRLFGRRRGLLGFDRDLGRLVLGLVVRVRRRILGVLGGSSCVVLVGLVGSSASSSSFFRRPRRCFGVLGFSGFGGGGGSSATNGQVEREYRRAVRSRRPRRRSRTATDRRRRARARSR